MKNKANTNKLNFNKSVVTELNDIQLNNVIGGTNISPIMSIIIYTGGEDGQFIKITK